MSAAAPRPAQDPWRDVEGAHLSLFCWVEQVRESPQPTALPSRRHQHGQILGRGLDTFYVRFEDNVLVSLPPCVLRLLPDAPGGD
ncbi:MAG: hypothetical protein ACRDRX_16835 [Pseudonocardiaceae bacterium]